LEIFFHQDIDICENFAFVQKNAQLRTIYDIWTRSTYRSVNVKRLECMWSQRVSSYSFFYLNSIRTAAKSFRNVRFRLTPSRTISLLWISYYSNDWIKNQAHV